MATTKVYLFLLGKCVIDNTDPFPDLDHLIYPGDDIVLFFFIHIC